MNATAEVITVRDVEGHALRVGSTLTPAGPATGRYRVVGQSLDPRYEDEGQVCGQLLVVDQDSGEELEFPVFNIYAGQGYTEWCPDLALIDEEKEL